MKRTYPKRMQQTPAKNVPDRNWNLQPILGACESRRILNMLKPLMINDDTNLLNENVSIVVLHEIHTSNPNTGEAKN